ncbi:MAG: orotidine 5'-phosphate decarboxylase [Candidatus Nezhaarchaeales archaeon]|nr:MAG: orotidine-5'-phosphate decarboxylase [Candidatus Nezhaarchaeota archaeon WYZ-LMO8]TDA36011.1 MAG: orotidine-5'-phosphate decarboxylase [Candidatus Nezhaarchaeota archaeon WYZ-LMO7]
MSKGFVEAITRAANQNHSRVVLALDVKGPNTIEKAKKILEETSGYICCVKINKHLILSVGLEGLRELVERAHSLGLPVIVDCKMCDIGPTNLVETSYYFDSGFDAVTVMPLPGWIDGLSDVFHVAKERDKGVLVVVLMSHKGASEFFETIAFDEEYGVFDKLYRIFARRAVKWRADGVIVGATRPDAIRQVKSIVGEVPIFSPGIVVQGGVVEETLKAGASYVIAGRAICESINPADKARELRDITRRFS